MLNMMMPHLMRDFLLKIWNFLKKNERKSKISKNINMLVMLTFKLPSLTLALGLLVLGHLAVVVVMMMMMVHHAMPLQFTT